MAKVFTGIVTSDKPEKTIVVAIENRTNHPVYKKQYSVTKKFVAHDEKNEAAIGDTVRIVETKPISKRKTFALDQVVTRAPITHEEAAPGSEPKEEESS